MSTTTSPEGSPQRSSGAEGAVVTGGTSGIGLAITLRLARRGLRVYAVSRRGEGDTAELDRGVAELGVPRPTVLTADVTERDQLEAVAKRMADDQVTPRVVVGSAGINVRSLALDVPDEAVHRMIDTNLYGLFATFQVFAPSALASSGSRFVAISSLNAVHGMRLRAPYSATKAGVSGLVRALAVEWGPQGATVNAIAPGIIETPLTRGYMDEHPDRTAAGIAHTPVGRLGRVDDIAHAAEYLVSPEASFVNGQTLVVDGGLSAGSAWW